eukprot:15400197-Alexandrium_andersonii.AAC.1
MALAGAATPPQCQQGVLTRAELAVPVAGALGDAVGTGRTATAPAPAAVASATCRAEQQHSSSTNNRSTSDAAVTGIVRNAML